jgi:glycosyltransferase involved in cell wall biosynthesis
MLKVLMVTSEWPSPARPTDVPFVVRQVKSLREAGVEVDVFAFHGRKNPLNYFKAWRQLRTSYDLNAFDLVHGQFGQSGLVALPTKRPFVLTFWGSDLHGYVNDRGRYTLSGFLLRWLSLFVARRSQAIIVVSEHLKQFLSVKVPIYTIAHGVSFDLFRPMPQAEARRQLGWPADKKYILFGANPQNPIKRYHLAQTAVHLIKDQFNVELIAMTDISHENVPLYMNASDVLVLTSTHEGSPTVVKEALACNLPVVSVNVGDVSLMLDKLPGCVICANDKPETVAAGLAQVLQGQQCANSREQFSFLDEVFVAKKIVEVYQSTLQQQTRKQQDG